MPLCPVCQVRYAKSQTFCCPVCGWDLQPLTVLTGMIPEVVEKETIRLQWAKKLWHSVQSQREKLHQLQIQLKQNIEPVPKIQTPLTPVSQEQTAPTEAFHHPEISSMTLHHPSEQVNPTLTSSVSVASVATPPETSEPKPEPQSIENEAVNSAAPEIKPQKSAPTINAQHRVPATPAISPANALPMNDAIVETLQPQKRIFLPANPPNLAKSSNGTTATAVALLPTQITTQAFDFDVVAIQQEKVERRKHSASCFLQSLEADINLEMVWVPGGSFWMGSPDSEAERDSHEAPQHEVTLAPFYMSRFPITQAQWHAIATQPKIQRSLSLYPANFEGDDRPIEMVSWYDAIEFCARLSQHAGQLYRLPSEAEWEYACRAGTTTPFHFGETLLPDWANYDGNYTYGSGRPGHYRQETTSVGASETANAFGLADMHGNVWEWCADPWHENYDDAPTDGSVWTSDEGGNYQVLRGGAWYCLPGLCRSAQRHWNQPDVGGSGIGFRVVCVMP
jgi:formylglycine-generating enzyme required for sulfatase activity